MFFDREDYCQRTFLDEGILVPFLLSELVPVDKVMLHSRWSVVINASFLEMKSYFSLPLFCGLLAMVSIGSSLRSSADEGVSLRIKWNGDEFSFRVVGEDGPGEWLLQFSQDGRDWQDLLFLERAAELGGIAGADVSPVALPVPDAPAGLFRAVQFSKVDSFYRDYLAARFRWRASGITSYQYGFRWSTMIFWRGNISVVDGEVSSYERLEAFPPFFEEPPLYRTIDGLFDRIADAWASNAASIRVTWDRQFGYPRSVFIDQSLMIADEEQSWTIESLEPGP